MIPICFLEFQNNSLGSVHSSETFTGLAFLVDSAGSKANAKRFKMSERHFQNRTIAFVDILGFDGIVQSTSDNDPLFAMLRDALKSPDEQSRYFQRDQRRHREKRGDFAKRQSSSLFGPESTDDGSFGLLRPIRGCPCLPCSRHCPIPRVQKRRWLSMLRRFCFPRFVVWQEVWFGQTCTATGDVPIVFRHLCRGWLRLLDLPGAEEE